jgi:uncharacterized protein YgbK (DUF1537 family)
MTQVLIIADDLSGAADCASAFVKAGLETLVLIDLHAGQSTETESVAVLSIDADTRRLPGAEAAQIHLGIYHRYSSPRRLLYKKIDSTLRGNFAEELGAIVPAAGMAIVAPAFPQAGRFTKNGHQFLNDTPLELTEIWRSEGIPGTAHIPGMLARHGINTESVGIAEIRQGTDHLRAVLESCANNGVQAVVCDVETDDDLRVIAQASVSLSVPRFWVGSAGLANHLSAAAYGAANPVLTAPLCPAGSILTVVGSLSSVSRAQAQYLFDHGGMERIDVPASVLREGQTNTHWQQLRDTLDTALRNELDLLIMISIEEPVDIAEGLALCQALALLIAPLADHIGAVIATGGETARAILTAMGSTALRLVGEVEPGVPLSVAANGTPINVITKAGAFGARDTLMHCYETLRQARLESARSASCNTPSASFHRNVN